MSLSVKNISKKIYGKNIVTDVSFDIQNGEIIGLLGPNGAGKSTSFYITAGLIQPTTGKILLNDNDISHFPAYKRASIGIIYLPQDNSIFQNMTTEENIMIALDIKENNTLQREEKLNQLLKDFSIENIRYTKGIALSGGERRRVEIARCIATKPSYILLDEPFAGIDPIAIRDIKALILQLSNSGIGILITDHNVKDALSIVNRAYIIYEGKVLAHGTTQELLINSLVQEVYLGDSLSAI